MRHEEGQDQQAEANLQRFPHGHAEVATPVQRHQSQDDMETQRPIESHGPNETAPHPQEPDPPQFHRLQRDQPESVIGQMRRGIDEEHQSRAEQGATHLRRVGMPRKTRTVDGNLHSLP